MAIFRLNTQNAAASTDTQSPDPAFTGTIEPAQDGTAESAQIRVWGGNIADDQSPPDGVFEGARAVAISSGWFGEVGPDGVYPNDPRAWMPTGRTAGDEGIARLADRAHAAGCELWVRPHARHTLSDIPSCRTAMNAWAEAGGISPRLLLDPAALLTGETIIAAEEHLERIFFALASHDRAAAIILSGVERAPSDPAAAVPVPLGEGDVPADLILKLWRSTGADRLPVVLRGDDASFTRQQALIADSETASGTAAPANLD